MMLILAEKIKIEISNDVMNAHRKYMYFQKRIQTECVEFKSVLPTTNSASILSTVIEIHVYES